MTPQEKARQIAGSLADKAYSESFVDAEIATTIPFQIRAMRLERGWTQADLAAKTDQHQSTISAFENPDIGPQSIESLRRIAAAFDVGLLVRFAPFSELVDWSVNMSKESHVVPGRTKDAKLRAQQCGESLSPRGKNGVARPMEKAAAQENETARDAYCAKCRDFTEVIWTPIKEVAVHASGRAITFNGLLMRCRICDFEITKVGRVT